MKKFWYLLAALLLLAVFGGCPAPEDDGGSDSGNLEGRKPDYTADETPAADVPAEEEAVPADEEAAPGDEEAAPGDGEGEHEGHDHGDQGQEEDPGQ